MLAGQPLAVTPFCRRSWRTRGRLAPSSSAFQARLGQRSRCALRRWGLAQQVPAGSKGHRPQTAGGAEAPGKAHDAPHGDRPCHQFPSVLNTFLWEGFLLTIKLGLTNRGPFHRFPLVILFACRGAVWLSGLILGLRELV